MENMDNSGIRKDKKIDKMNYRNEDFSYGDLE
jgi:hypothetical protein